MQYPTIIESIKHETIIGYRTEIKSSKGHLTELRRHPAGEIAVLVVAMQAWCRDRRINIISRVSCQKSVFLLHAILPKQGYPQNRQSRPNRPHPERPLRS